MLSELLHIAEDTFSLACITLVSGTLGKWIVTFFPMSTEWNQTPMLLQNQLYADHMLVN
jgi:hypothetical protein